MLRRLNTLTLADHADVTVSHTQISRMVQNVDTDKMHQLFYEAHKEVDKIAQMFDIDEQTAWAKCRQNNLELSFWWIPRRQNREADRLSKDTLLRVGVPLKIQPEL